MNEKVISESSACEECPLFEWPSADFFSCVEIPPFYLNYTDPIAIAVVAISAILLVGTFEATKYLYGWNLYLLSILVAIGVIYLAPSLAPIAFKMSRVCVSQGCGAESSEFPLIAPALL